MNGYDFIQLVVFKMQYAYRFTMHIIGMTTQGGSHDSAEFRYSDCTDALPQTSTVTTDG